MPTATNGPLTSPPWPPGLPSVGSSATSCAGALRRPRLAAWACSPCPMLWGPRCCRTSAPATPSSSHTCLPVSAACRCIASRTCSTAWSAARWPWSSTATSRRVPTAMARRSSARTSNAIWWMRCVAWPRPNHPGCRTARSRASGTAATVCSCSGRNARPTRRRYSRRISCPAYRSPSTPCSICCSLREWRSPATVLTTRG
mmetsp:Transcript_38697/g.90510  ORF Transcript_38697/g.90510 Transcript_38697/m.90510 type:complete len:201 (-) Transcript_38697:2736-3338(-)